MAGWAWSYVSVIRAVVLLLLVCLLFIVLTTVGIGEKTMVDETITLSPGAQKTYNLPPGMVKVEIMKTDTPIDDVHSSLLGGNGRGYGTTGGYMSFGSPVFSRYTIVNPDTHTANVSLRISTGALNPFGYIGITGSP